VVEGIGRPRVEPSFNPNVIDHMIKVPDAAWLSDNGYDTAPYIDQMERFFKNGTWVELEK